MEDDSDDLHLRAGQTILLLAKHHFQPGLLLLQLQKLFNMLYFLCFTFFPLDYLMLFLLSFYKYKIQLGLLFYNSGGDKTLNVEIWGS